MVSSNKVPCLLGTPLKFVSSYCLLQIYYGQIRTDMWVSPSDHQQMSSMIHSQRQLFDSNVRFGFVELPTACKNFLNLLPMFFDFLVRFSTPTTDVQKICYPFVSIVLHSIHHLPDFLKYYSFVLLWHHASITVGFVRWSVQPLLSMWVENELLFHFFTGKHIFFVYL